MPLTDLPLDQLGEFRPDVLEPADFDVFWASTLDESRALAWAPRLERVQTVMRTVEVYDVTFAGYRGQPIRAWLTVPADAVGPLPAVVEYQGYNGGRGLAGERLFWASAGYAHFFMDTRGQGSGWGTGGDTPDPEGSDASVAGWMTRGILDPKTYYYRRVFTDAALAIDAARSLVQVDAGQVSLAGGSQGGGIALAAAALVPDVCAVMPDVPFLCHFRRAAEITAVEPFTEISRYLAVHRDAVDQVFDTLSYFDGVNFARRAQVPAWFSAAMMDPITPPSTIAGAHKAYAGDSALHLWPFNGHEAGGPDEDALVLAFLASHLRR